MKLNQLSSPRSSGLPDDKPQKIAVKGGLRDASELTRGEAHFGQL